MNIVNISLILLGLVIAFTIIIAEIVMKVKKHGCTYEVDAVVEQMVTIEVQRGTGIDAIYLQTKVPVYKFVYNNQTYSVQGKAHVIGKIKEGDTTKLYIDPSNPSHFYASNEKYTVLKWALLIGGSALAIYGISCLIWMLI